MIRNIFNLIGAGLMSAGITWIYGLPGLIFGLGLYMVINSSFASCEGGENGK